MSVYGGFCTRKQESEYNSCIYKIIYTLSKRCCKDMDGGNIMMIIRISWWIKICGMHN